MNQLRSLEECLLHMSPLPKVWLVVMQKDFSVAVSGCLSCTIVCNLRECAKRSFLKKLFIFFLTFSYGSLLLLLFNLLLILKLLLQFQSFNVFQQKLESIISLALSVSRLQNVGSRLGDLNGVESISLRGGRSITTESIVAVGGVGWSWPRTERPSWELP